jgi:uncharacterized protein YjdB
MKQSLLPLDSGFFKRPLSKLIFLLSLCACMIFSSNKADAQYGYYGYYGGGYYGGSGYYSSDYYHKDLYVDFYWTDDGCGTVCFTDYTYDDSYIYTYEYYYDYYYGYVDRAVILAYCTLSEWEYDFGDGSSTYGYYSGGYADACHTYSYPGTYTVTLYVTDDCGYTEYWYRYVTVYDVGSTASAGTVSVSPGTICAGNTATASDFGSSGTGSWSSDNTLVATVDGYGNVTGVDAGTADIIYSVSGCFGATSTASATITVDNPDPGTITLGSSEMCSTGSTTAHTSGTSGGTWSSSNTSVATINASTGAITGVGAGSTTITYSITDASGCTGTATATLVVDAPLHAGTLSLYTSVCAGSTTNIVSSGDAGGSWTSSNASVASVDDLGDITGVSGGTVTFTYSLSNACGTASATLTTTVGAPPVVGPITGTDSVCVHSSITLHDTTLAGHWHTASGAIANVYSTGLVTGVAAGTTIIYYVKGNSCGYDTQRVSVLVKAAPVLGAITGTDSLCTGTTTTLSDSVAGGRWSSSSTSIDTVGASGVVYGISEGTSTVRYILSNSCGSTTATAPIHVLGGHVGAVTGASRLCVGSTTTLTDSTAGGGWSSSAATVATISSAGVVTALSAGTTLIIYGVSNICGTVQQTDTLTVLPAPVIGAITGSTVVCMGTHVTLSDTTSGGSWSSTNHSVATIPGYIPIVTPHAVGSDTIFYKVLSASCGWDSVSLPITVSAIPTVASITGTPSTCVGSSTTLADTTSGGIWYITDSTKATVGSTGGVTGVATGTTTVRYVVTNTCGSGSATQPVTVITLPYVSSIAGTTSVCTGASASVTDSTAAGKWSSSVPAVATVDSSTGAVTPLSSGTTTVTYLVSNACGSASANKNITVLTSPSAGSISGSTTVCTGVTTTLTDATIGGIWSSSDTTKATVNSAGIVTGVASGTTTIRYTVTNICGVASATWNLTVNPSPVAGTITGSSTLCMGTNDTLVDVGGSGGSWTTSSILVAAVFTPSSGVIRGLSAGTATIKYTVTNSCGSASTTKVVTVNGLPTASSIAGATTICVGGTTSLTDVSTGGTWSSTNTSISTVATTGLVSGLAVGTDSIKYVVTNGCGSATALVPLHVITMPALSPISGSATVCTGSSTSLSDTATGGTWSVADGTIASIATTGVVTGIATGSTTVKYVLTNSCGSSSVTAPLSVMILPTVGSISGSSSVCAGASITLTDTTSSGSWSSSSPGVATVSSAGIVTGVAAGADTITYSATNSCGTAKSYVVIAAMPAPVVSPISGSSVLCSGGSATLSDTTHGGVWSSSSPTVASVSSTGIVSGLSQGTGTVTYTYTNTCGSASSTASITVNRKASTITGVFNICRGATQTLSDSATGGLWSSSNPAVATISSGGVVSALSSGTTTIKYAVTNVCGTSSGTALITVSNPASAISGSTAICKGSSATLSDSTGGGTWSSSAPSVASVGTTGVVTAVSAGTATVTYTVTNLCGTTSTSSLVSVVRSASAITGASPLCRGASATLADSANGGTWSSSNSAIATISTAGVVTAVSQGTTTISYVVTNVCGASTATASLTVANPASALVGSSALCAGSSISLADSAAGGTWSSSNAAVATVSTAGVVAGVSQGTTMISYNVSNACGATSATSVISVNRAAGAIRGSSSVCKGATITLSDTAVGGTWLSSNTSVATINSAGIVTGITPGTTVISYIVSNACGASTATLTLSVNTIASSISGLSAVCVGASTMLIDSTASGVWASANPSVAIVSPIGVVTGVSQGSVYITYSVTNACGATVSRLLMNVSRRSSVFSGAAICQGGTALLSDSATGGTWYSANPAVASISTSGTVYAVSQGTVMMHYNLSNVCGASSDSAVVTVNRRASAIGGVFSVCRGTSTTLVDTAGGSATWTSSNTSVATITPAGVVSAISVGTTTITYTVSNICGTSIASGVLSVGAPASPLTPATLCRGATTTMSDSTAGGTWSSSYSSVASVSSTGVVTAISQGTTLITYSVFNGCGSTAAGTYVTVNRTPSVITGSATLCVGSAYTFTDTATGGYWTSTNPSMATVSSAGVVSALTTGVDTIKYTTYNACGTASAFKVVTITTAPTVASITGTTTLCAAAHTTLSDATSGGSWSVGSTSIATIASTGIVTGVSAGTTSAIYSLTTGCGTVSATTSLTINTVPYVAAISGSTTICAGATTTLTDSSTGGTWSTYDGTIATVSSRGVVAGIMVRGGTTHIAYIVSNACGYGEATTTLTVTALPSVTPIAGVGGVCQGSTLSLADSVSGGTWSSNHTSLATVTTAGVVSGISPGTDTITYSVTNSCGTVAVKKVVTVVGLPRVPPISGTFSLCSGSTTTLSDSTTGGSWSSVKPAIATVSTAGVVTALGSGTTVIRYLCTNGCGATTDSVLMTISSTPAVSAITGSTALCTGAHITLSDGTAGGAWTSTNTSVATVNSSGVVTGVASGPDSIKYTLTNSCGTSVARYAVNVVTSPVVGAITGTSSVCSGATVTLSDATPGGVWSSLHTTVATVSTAGVVTGGSATSTDSIAYTVTSACGSVVAYDVVTVTSPSAGTITGPVSVCTGSTITLSDAAVGGVWSSLHPSIATVTSSSGVVTGLTSGVDTIFYKVNNSCGSGIAIYKVTVNALPYVSAIGGPSSVCRGNTITLTDATTGGTWASTDTAVANVSTAGVVTGRSVGADSIKYICTNSCGTVVGYKLITVNIAPTVATITGPSAVAAGATISLSDATPGGTWSSAHLATATVTSTGAVRGVAIGSDVISYIVTNSCGSATSTHTVSVTAAAPPSEIADSESVTLGVTNSQEITDVFVYPNPAQAVVNVKATIPVDILLYSLDGMLLRDVHRDNVVDISGLANGVYLIEVYDEQGRKLKTARVVKLQ